MFAPRSNNLVPSRLELCFGYFEVTYESAPLLAQLLGTLLQSFQPLDNLRDLAVHNSKNTLVPKVVKQFCERNQ